MTARINFLRDSRGVSPERARRRSCGVSDLGISLTISLAARRWILSSCSLSFCERLHHAVEAYSRKLVIISGSATESTWLAVVCQVPHLLTGLLGRLRKWFLFRFTLLVAFDYFCAIYSKCHPGFGIIIAMCNYLQRDFVPKMKIREGHLYLHSSLCEDVDSPAQSNLNV